MNSITDEKLIGIPSKTSTVAYYGLLTWWNDSFTIIQKNYIINKYRPMGGGGLLDNNVTGSSVSVINFLIGLQSWFTTLRDENISEKILLKAESLISDNIPLLDIHFLYSCFIEHYYKKRKINQQYYELAIFYCKKQISISHLAKESFLSEFQSVTLPRHIGFEQLSIILEKEKKYHEAIEVCKLAHDIGWNSDWQKRILRLQKKVSS